MKLNLKWKAQADAIYNLPIEKLEPHSQSPRKSLDNYEFNKLVESIRINGIIQPLITVKDENKYKIISGVRRYKAAERLGLSSLPCRILKKEDNPWLIPIIESLTHSPISIFEQAEEISELLERQWLTPTEAAEQLGFTQKGLCDTLKILNFTADERKKILRGGLEQRHLKALLRLHDELTRMKALDIILARGMTPTESERYVESILNPPTEQKKEIPQNTALFFDKRVLENTLRKVVSTAEKAGIRLEFSKKEDDYTDEYIFKIQKELVKN